MHLQVLQAKIHRASVTEANMNYVGSVTIDENLLDATGLLPYELVHVNNLANGYAWETYIIPGPNGNGDICLNGPPARHFQPGDKVIILGYRWLEEAELKSHRPVMVFVDEKNEVTEIKHGEMPFEKFPSDR